MANLHSKLEVSNFNSSLDRESQISKTRSHDLFPTPFDLILHLFVSTSLNRAKFKI